MTLQELPIVSPEPMEVAPAPAERMHPISRRLVAGVLAGGIALTGLAVAYHKPIERFIDNPVDSMFDPLFPHEASFPANQ